MLIYLTTNNIKGKVYVGKYCGKQKSYLGSGIYIKRAIKKYGKENFSRITLEDGITDHDFLCEREKYWIAFYDSTNPEIGYNLTEGGRGSLGLEHSKESCRKISEANKGKNHPMYGKHLSEETCKKMRDAWKNRAPIAEETRKKLSEASRGENNPNYGKRGKDTPMFGKTHIKETCKKMSNAKRGINNPKIIKKEIILVVLKLLNSGMSVKNTAKKVNVSRGTVYKVKNGGYNDIYDLKEK